MANNYQQGVMRPAFPPGAVTEADEALLDAYGFIVERDSDGQCWLTEDGLHGETPEEFPDSPTWPEVIQDILQRPACKDIPYFVLEGAAWCDKNRPGEFGGYVVFITREEIKEASTFSLVNQWELEARPVE